MKIQKTILFETFRIAVGTLALSVIMNVVFFALNAWDISVLYGTILGYIVAVVNFLLLGITVQIIANNKDSEKRNKLKLQLSYSLRMLLVLGIVAFGVTRDYLSPFSLVLPLFFPRITIALMQILGFYKPEKKIEETSENEVQEGDLN